MNPILSMLNSSGEGNLLSRIMEIKTMMEGRNADQLYNELLQNNEQFRQFMQQNQGKSVEQVAQEHGINPQLLK